MQGAALPIGSILDKVGPQKTAILGSLVFLLGNFVFGLQITKGGEFAPVAVGGVVLLVENQEKELRGLLQPSIPMSSGTFSSH